MTAPGAADRATLVLGVLLIVALTFLSWHADGPPPTAGGAPGRTAVQGPGAIAGIGAALLSGITVTWLALATLPSRPPVGRPGAGVLLGLTVAVLGFVLIKLVSDRDGLARGAWVSVVLALALVGGQVADRRRRPVRP